MEFQAGCKRCCQILTFCHFQLPCIRRPCLLNRRSQLPQLNSFLDVTYWLYVWQANREQEGQKENNMVPDAKRTRHWQFCGESCLLGLPDPGIPQYFNSHVGRQDTQEPVVQSRNAHALYCTLPNRCLSS